MMTLVRQLLEREIDIDGKNYEEVPDAIGSELSGSIAIFFGIKKRDGVMWVPKGRLEALKKLDKEITAELASGKIVTEDWKKNLATGLLAGSLLASPNVADAAQRSAHHKQHVSHGLSHKTYSEQDIINSIVGEAGGEGYQGMLAVASAIRNRAKTGYYKNNVLHGVFGKNAKHIKTEPQQTFVLAKKAWDESLKNDIVGGAYIWGNDSDLRLFAQQSWFKNVKPTTKIGGHTFFKDKRA